jgi:hypothetical protein
VAWEIYRVIWFDSGVYGAQVLSDLNKHMRTVHHTYRRKAKIPKDMISELDNPALDIEPQIYGAKSFKQPPAAVTPSDEETAVPLSSAENSSNASPPLVPPPLMVPQPASRVLAPATVGLPPTKAVKTLPPLLPVGAAVVVAPVSLLRIKTSPTTTAGRAPPLISSAAASSAMEQPRTVTMATAKSGSGGGEGERTGRDLSLETIKQELGELMLLITANSSNTLMRYPSLNLS